MKKYLLVRALAIILILISIKTVTYCVQFYTESLEANIFNGVSQMDEIWYGGGSGRTKYTTYEAFTKTGNRVVLFNKGGSIPIETVTSSRLLESDLRHIKSTNPEYRIVPNITLFYTGRILFGSFCLWLGLTILVKSFAPQKK